MEGLGFYVAWEAAISQFMKCTAGLYIQPLLRHTMLTRAGDVGTEMAAFQTLSDILNFMLNYSKDHELLPMRYSLAEIE